MAVTPTQPPGATGAAAVPAGLQAQTQHLGEVVVEKVPERIALLARTILLSGTITEQKTGGAMVLRTQVGELVIRSQTPLPLDKVLTLQIPPGAPPVRAQVTLAQPALVPPVATPSSAPPVMAQPAASALPATLAGQPVPVPQSPAAGLPVGASGPLPAVPAAPAGVAVQVPATPLGQSPASAPITGNPTTARSVVGGQASGIPSATSPLAAAPLPGAALLGAPMLVAATQAIANLPLLSGTVIPAQVLALPDPAASQARVQLPLPPALSTFTEVQKGGAPVLQSLLPQGLTELLNKLPAQVLAPLQGNLPAAPAAGASQPTPAFANLPVLLTLPAGSQITLQVDSLTPPGQPPPAAQTVPAQAATAGLARPAPPSFSAVVVGQTPQGEPLATSPAGLLVLSGRAPMQPGTLVELSLLHAAEPAAEGESALAPRLRDWPVLQQILQAAAPAQAHTAARTARPENMGSAVAFLAAALKLGEPQRVLSNESIERLRISGQADMLARFTSEVQQAGQTFTRADAPATEWRSLSLPLPHDSQMQRLALHIRREKDSETEAADAQTVKHLVVEVELSRLGPLLLDGYIRPHRFDLTLRSQRRLPPQLQGELRLAYREALQVLSWQGGLEFQTAAELWLRG